MIFKCSFKTGVKDIGKDNLIKNKSILEMFENIGGYHSDLAGFGANDIQRTKLAWILLGWKLKVLNRPKYGQDIRIETWGRDAEKLHTCRDFEMYDGQGTLCAIGTSKWALLNIETNRITKLDGIMENYELEDKSVFENRELEKIKVPETFSNEVEYTVKRRDIDINGHMHNLYYLDLAYEALPEEIYQKRPFNEIQIQYKKEIKLGDTLKCKYAINDNKHTVCIYSQDEKILHALVTLF